MAAAPCANALFLTFLHELSVEAKARRNKQLVAAFERAAESLCKYPLPMTCGRDLLILDGVGEYIATKIDEKLRAYLRSHATVDENILRSPIARKMRRTSVGAFADPPRKRKLKEIEKNGTQALDSRKRQRTDEPAVVTPIPAVAAPRRAGTASASSQIVASLKKVRDYSPKECSGAWAVLLALYRATLTPHYRGWMLKEELQQAAKMLCTSSFEPQNGTYYSAWNSVKTLEQHELIQRKNRPVQFHLTHKGLALAERIAFDKKDDEAFTRAFDSLPPPPLVNWNRTDALLDEDDEQTEVLERPLTTIESPSRLASRMGGNVQNGDLLPAPAFFDEHVRISEAAGPLVAMSEASENFRDFDVVVLIDCRERSKGDRNRIQNALLVKGIQCETRSLELGDVLWIARSDNGEELVLNCIAERKIVSDLCASIIDGRYKEQKQRLKKCGLTGIYYIVEGTYTERLEQRFATIPATSVERAISSTIAEGFVVKRTATTSESVDWIAQTTATLSAKLKSGKIAPTTVSFEKFQERSVKTSDRTVTEVFATQLISLFQISSDKAFAVVSAYPTPHHLIRAYKSASSEKEKMKMLQDIRYGKAQRRLGPNISLAIYNLYCNSTYPSEPEL